LGIDDMVANNPNLHLQTSDLTVVLGNSMSDHNSKDRPFHLYAWREVFWMSRGILI
jgi:hypothetical protein